MAKFCMFAIQITAINGGSYELTKFMAVTELKSVNKRAKKKSMSREYPMNTSVETFEVLGLTWRNCRRSDLFKQEPI